MNVNKLFPSRWLKADDLGGREFTLTIREMKIESVGSPPQSEQKPILYFQGAEKGLIMNRTVAMTIAGLYGPETDNWPGKRVTLYSVKVRAFGAMHDAIRIKEQIPPPPRKAEPEPVDLPGDDISEADELLDGPPDLDVVEASDIVDSDGRVYEAGASEPDNPFDDVPGPDASAATAIIGTWRGPLDAQIWAVKVGACDNDHNARAAWINAVKACGGYDARKAAEVYAWFYHDRLEKLELNRNGAAKVAA